MRRRRAQPTAKPWEFRSRTTRLLPPPQDVPPGKAALLLRPRPPRRPPRPQNSEPRPRRTALRAPARAAPTLPRASPMLRSPRPEPPAGPLRRRTAPRKNRTAPSGKNAQRRQRRRTPRLQQWAPWRRVTGRPPQGRSAPRANTMKSRKRKSRTRRSGSRWAGRAPWSLPRGVRRQGGAARQGDVNQRWSTVAKPASSSPASRGRTVFSERRR